MSNEFDDAMKIVGLDEETVKKVKKAGLKRFNHFVTVPALDVRASLMAQDVTSGDLHDVLAFQVWYCKWHTDVMRAGIAEDFTMAAWESFLEVLADDNIKGPAVVAASTTITTVSSSKSSAMASLAKNLSNFKWDKNVPLMSKLKPIQDTYNNWEDLFMIQMTLAYVSPVLEDSYIKPTDPEELELDTKMQNIVRAALLQATIGTTAAPYLQMKDSGSDMFLGLRKIYKGAANSQRRAEEANHEMQTLEFGRKSKDTAEAFASRFILNLRRLEENGMPLAPSLVKSTFLSEITNPLYDVFRHIESKNTESFEVTLSRFHEEAQDLRAANNGTDPGGDANKKNVNNAKTDSTDKKSQQFFPTINLFSFFKSTPNLRTVRTRQHRQWDEKTDAKPLL